MKHKALIIFFLDSVVGACRPCPSKRITVHHILTRALESSSVNIIYELKDVDGMQHRPLCGYPQHD